MNHFSLNGVYEKNNFDVYGDRTKYASIGMTHKNQQHTDYFTHPKE